MTSNLKPLFSPEEDEKHLYRRGMRFYRTPPTKKRLFVSTASRELRLQEIRESIVSDSQSGTASTPRGKLLKNKSFETYPAPARLFPMSIQEGSQNVSLVSACSAEIQRRINSEDKRERSLATAQDTIVALMAMSNPEIVAPGDQDEALQSLIKHGLENPVPICTGVPLGPKSGDQHIFLLNKGVRHLTGAATDFEARCLHEELRIKAVLMGEEQGMTTPIFLPSVFQVADIKGAWDVIVNYYQRKDANSYVAREQLVSNIKRVHMFLYAYLESVTRTPWDSPFFDFNLAGEMNETSFADVDRSLRRASDGTVYIVQPDGVCLRLPKNATASFARETPASSSKVEEEEEE